MPRLTTLDCQKAIADAPLLNKKGKPAVTKIADGGGLYLMIKNRRAYWTWQYRTASGWSSKGFGTFAHVTPKRARKLADDYRADLRAGRIHTNARDL